MSSDTNIIYNVKKPKELVMLEKILSFICTTENEASYSVALFSVLLTGKTQLQKFQRLFFFSSFKNATQKTWILCAYKSKTSS